MNRWLKAGLTGARAGQKATVPMTAVMGAAKALGILGEAPPKKITQSALDAVGLGGKLEPAEKNATAFLAHLAFGAGMGAIYGVLREAGLLPRSPLSGILFGSAIWAVSYAGWVPALTTMPKPSHDRPLRPAFMLAAHWVYGASLERSLRAWVAPPPRSDTHAPPLPCSCPPCSLLSLRRSG